MGYHLKIKALILLISISISSFANEFAEIESGFKRFGQQPGEAQSTIQVSIIDYKQAEALFKEFATNNQEISFNYTVGGCMGRAHKMAFVAESKGIIMAKVFTEGRLQTGLRDFENRLIRWGRHVAPIVFVKSDEKQKPELMVFDPAIAKKPVPVKEWENSMLDTTDGFDSLITTTYFGARFQYTTRLYDSVRTEWQQIDFKSMEASLEGSR